MLQLNPNLLILPPTLVLSRFSHVQLFVTPWAVAHQAPPGKNTALGYHALLQGIFPTQGWSPHLFMSPALAGRLFTASVTGVVGGPPPTRVCALVTRSCLTLRDPLDCDRQPSLPMGFPRQGYWSGQLYPSPRNLPDPRIKSRSPALQADSLLSEPARKPPARTW